MTALDRKLAQTFRAARWEAIEGRLVCPDCFDSDGLIMDDMPRLAHAGLKSYRCRDCNTRFSDLSGTPLRGSSASLQDWALALLTLTGHPTQPSGNGARMKLALADLGPPLKRLVRMRQRFMGTRIAAEWLKTLRAEKVTVSKLAYGRRAA